MSRFLLGLVVGTILGVATLAFALNPWKDGH